MLKPTTAGILKSQLCAMNGKLKLGVGVYAVFHKALPEFNITQCSHMLQFLDPPV